MVDTGPNAGRELLKELEKELNASLPADYCEFLAEHDGGQPVPCTFRIPSHEEKAFDVQLFFGLSRPTEASNVLWNFRQYRSRLGDNLLPIGCTDTNDLILLELTGHGAGRIVFWDSTSRSPDRAIHQVSGSLREFLDALGGTES